MSGHSHYATIHRQKDIKDAQKGRIFSKLAREISIAVKSGGGADPLGNYKLRMVIDKARAANMPKDNVDRAITKGEGGEALEEVTYEGFGPGGISVIVEAATDNRNRTSQEIKNLFERGGGTLAGPGAVSFNFDPKALFIIQKDKDPQNQILQLIDLGIEDFEETDDSIEIYVPVDKLKEVRDSLEQKNIPISQVELIKKPKNYQEVGDLAKANSAMAFLEKLEDGDDVQRVFTNLSLPDAILAQMKAS